MIKIRITGVQYVVEWKRGWHKHNFIVEGSNGSMVWIPMDVSTDAMKDRDGWREVEYIVLLQAKRMFEDRFGKEAGHFFDSAELDGWQ